MVDHRALRRESLVRILAVVRGLGVGDSLDVILARITDAVVDVLGFGAVVVNVKVPGGGLVVTTAVGPPEVRDMVGETMSHETWIDLLAVCEQWGELRFHENLSKVDVDGDVAYRDPNREHYLAPPEADADHVWRPEYALLAPMWSGPKELLGVLSVDLPASGLVPDAEQRAMLELFAGQAGAAIAEAARIGSAHDEQLQYRVVFLDSPIPTAMLGLDSCIVEVNQAFEQLVGKSDQELRGLDLSAVFGGEGEHLGILDQQVLRTDGEDRWAHVRLQKIEGASGTRYVCTAEDRTAEHRALDGLRLRAERDDLTGLWIRSVALIELADRMRDLRDTEVVAFLYCDLDGFKAINDEYGHLVGDQVLVDIAARIAGCAHVDDRVCRLGGDEFAVVATRETIEEIEDLADRCASDDARDDHARDEDSGVHSDRVGMSVGVCAVTARASGRHAPDFVVESADSMLYRAKRHGGRTWRITTLD